MSREHSAARTGCRRRPRHRGWGQVEGAAVDLTAPAMPLNRWTRCLQRRECLSDAGSERWVGSTVGFDLIFHRFPALLEVGVLS